MNGPDSLHDCPSCGAPAEVVPWHEASSLRRVEAARCQCIFGHWSLSD